MDLSKPFKKKEFLPNRGGGGSFSRASKMSRGAAYAERGNQVCGMKTWGPHQGTEQSKLLVHPEIYTVCSKGEVSRMNCHTEDSEYRLTGSLST